MKKSAALLIALILSLGLVAPALAYDGVTGTVIDSKTSSPWQYGGDVLIVDRDTNMIVATCMVELLTGKIIGAPGPNSCDYGSNVLFEPSGSDPNPFGTPPVPMEVIIDFSCAISGSCSGGPLGTPAPIILHYDEAAPLSSLLYPLGNVPTGTGPLAVQLSGMSGASSLAVALVLAVVAGGSMLVKKAQSKESENAYISPEVVYEGVIEVQAGSPRNDWTGLISYDLL